MDVFVFFIAVTMAPNMALGTFWHPFLKVSLKNPSRRTLLKIGAKPLFRCQGAKTKECKTKNIYKFV